MKAKNYKISPAIQNEIEELAKKFPKVAAIGKSGKPVYKLVQVTGATLLDRGYKSTNSNPILSEGLYAVNEVQYVNHVVQMVRAYQEEGRGGIIKYQAYIESLRTIQQLNFDKSIDGKPWYTRIGLYMKFYFEAGTGKIKGLVNNLKSA